MKTIFVTYAVKEEFVPLQLKNNHITYIRTGIGKTRSAYLLTKYMCENKPALVLNIGTAGTLHHQIGDIFIASHFIDRDYEAIRLPGIEYRIDGTELTSDNAVLKEWVATQSYLGICSTGDTFVTEVSAQTEDMVDMEAYAQAHVCRESGIPFLSVKYITDIIGKNSVEHWEDKLSEAREGLIEWCREQELLEMLDRL